MKILHSPACRKLLSSWWGEPRESVRYRLAGIGYDHTDIQIRDLLLTILDEDPADSDAVAAARELWPLLVLTEPLHTPDELLDEIDALTADIERVRMRTEMLAAKYRALEPWSERWNRVSADPEEAEYGSSNIDYAASDLNAVRVWLSHKFVREQLAKARGYAAKIREYDDTTEENR
ncbi:hypothetical protein ACWCW7_34515 [Nocardia tengchongensis]